MVCYGVVSYDGGERDIMDRERERGYELGRWCGD